MTTQFWQCGVCGCLLSPDERQCDHKMALEINPGLRSLSDFQLAELSPHLGGGPMPDFSQD